MGGKPRGAVEGWPVGAPLCGRPGWGKFPTGPAPTQGGHIGPPLQRDLTGHLERVPDIEEQRVRRLPMLAVELEADAGADGADGRVVAGAQADAVLDLGHSDVPPVGPDVAAVDEEYATEGAG